MPVMPSSSNGTRVVVPSSRLSRLSSRAADPAIASMVVTTTRLTPGRPGLTAMLMPGATSPKASGIGSIWIPAGSSTGGVIASAAVRTSTVAASMTSIVMRLRNPSSQPIIRPPSR